MTPEELIGKKLGDLEILGVDGRCPHGKSLLLTKCSCGEMKHYRVQDLKRRRGLHCGCRNANRLPPKQRQTSYLTDMARRHDARMRAMRLRLRVVG